MFGRVPIPELGLKTGVVERAFPVIFVPKAGGVIVGANLPVGSKGGGFMLKEPIPV
jgi:hypothetical protein